jgi:EAL domain-containing protein (putative c-di-GMP-specific phosphodiesterase class I)
MLFGEAVSAFPDHAPACGHAEHGSPSASAKVSVIFKPSFPFDKIKIDRSFVSELAAGGESMAIVRAVTALGRSLGISTTAEGVETAEQLSLLRSEGCNEVQGFLFSPALPAAEVEKMLRRRLRVVA